MEGQIQRLASEFSDLIETTSQILSMVAEIQTEVCLFDLDGTLISSTGAVEKAWEELIERFSLDGEGFFKHIHGVRTVEVFKQFIPDFAADAQKHAEEFEYGISNNWGHLAVPINGACEFLQSLPKERWCIVTSGTPGIAHGWFRKVLTEKGYPKPDIFITAADVTEGKPDPAGYNMGADLLAKQNGAKSYAERVVFEDAPAGIKAGVAAGATVIGIKSSFPKEAILAAGASYVVEDLSNVKLVSYKNGVLTLSIDHL